MARRKREHFTSPPAVGGISLLVVFAVLCLTVFALLSLTTVRADGRLSEASAQAVRDYYAADCEAQEILARLLNGETPEGVEISGSGLEYAGYTVPISETQDLQVEVILRGVADRDYVVTRWQAVPAGQWIPEEDLDLWDGTLPF